jgi:uncharacterized protein
MTQPSCGQTSRMTDDADEPNDLTPVPLASREAAIAAPDFAGAVQPSYWRTLFLGSRGLRSGWSFVFYAAMFYPLQLLAVQLAGSLTFGRAGELWSMLFGEMGSLLAAALPALVMGRVESRVWGTYGLPRRSAFGRLFWLGTVWGFLGITLLLCALHGAHAFDFGHLALHGARIAKFAAFWGLTFLMVAFFEEFLLRGYTQFTLARGMGFWPAAVLLSAAFGGVHLRNAGEGWAGALAAAVIGLFLCLTLRRTGNLWFAVGFHAAWDWGETFFYSVPDSGSLFPGHLLSSSFHGSPWLTGGSVGPEGSVLCFVVVAILWIAFDRAYREVRYQTE